MNFRCQFAFLLIAVTTVTSVAFGARVATGNPESAWKNYLQEDTNTAPGYQFPFSSCFKAAAATYDLPETLLLAIARGESDFDPTARSKANAHGVMQILWPGTANHLGIFRLTELYDPCTNIDAGARYFKELLGRFHGNLHLALAAYNYGPERIASDPDNIPEGARWYSDYIFRHLTYVLGDGKRTSPGPEFLYSALGKTELVRFAEPYRAAAFVDGLEQRSPALQLDWFRLGVGKFSVVLLYEDKDQYDNSAKLLKNAGFPLDNSR